MLEIKKYDSAFEDIKTKVLDRSGFKPKDFCHFLEIDPSSFTDPFLYQDMDRAVEMVLSVVENNTNVGILVDPDADGFTSASMIHLTLRRLGLEPQLILIHEDKSHGLDKKMTDIISGSLLELLIIPDASSNDHTYHKELLDNGVNVLVIDHHIISDISKIDERLILVSNQRNRDDENKHLTGAGMCLKFAQAVYLSLGYEFNPESDDFVKILFELASVGQVADVSDISDAEIRYILNAGLWSDILHPLIKLIINDKMGHVEYDNLDRLAPIDLSFSINPMLNAITRVGDFNENMLVYESLVELEPIKDRIVTRRRKVNGKFKQVELHWSIHELSYDIMQKVKRRQDKIVNNLKDKIINNIQANAGIVIAILENVTNEEANVIGLSANKVANDCNKPAIILREGGDYLTGSGRGYRNTIESLRDWVRETEYAEAEGHDNAFGIRVHMDNLDNFISKAISIEPDKKSNIVYVDELFSEKDFGSNKLISYKIKESYYARFITGGKIEEIKHGFKNLLINHTQVSVLGKGTTLKITKDNIEFMFFGVSEELVQTLKNEKGGFIFNIVGVPRISNWFGKKSLQIIVEDYHYERL